MVDFEQIQAAGENAIASGEIIAAGVAVIEGSEITYVNGFGKTRFDEKGAPVTADTLFPYCSISKTLNAIVVMRLVEEGHLKLDRPVVEYLPGFAFRNADYGERITLRHLLSHTSGLPMGGRFHGLETEDALARAIWEEIPHYRFSAEPGLVTNYSNTVACMAGYIAEAVMGRSYDDLLAEYVLEPLGMDSPRWDLTHTAQDQLIFTHRQDADGQLSIDEQFPLNRAGHPSSFYKGSVHDLAKAARMFLNADVLLGAEALTEMMTPHCSTHLESATHLFGRQELAHGLGLMIGDYRGHKMVRHAGGRAGHQNFFQLFPEQNRAVVILTSCVSENALMQFVQDVEDAVLELEPTSSIYMPPPEIVPTPSTIDVSKLTGRFLNPARQQLIEIALENNTLHLLMNDNSYPLAYTTSGEFVGEINENHTLPVYFVTDSSGDCDHVTVFGAPYQRNMEALPTNFDRAVWANYVGQYCDPFNTDPDDILKVVLESEQLFIYEGQTAQAAQPLSEYRFLTHLGVAEFEISADNEIIAVQIAHTARYFPV